MKTIGRILIILAAFAIVMGIAYTVANAVSAGSSSASTTAPVGERGSEGFPPGGTRPEFGGEAPMGGGWMFGLMKNVGIVAIIVLLTTLPKSLLQRRRRAIPVRFE